MNVGFLVEIPLQAIEAAIVGLLAERGFGDVRPAHSRVFTSVAGQGSRITDMAAKALLTKQAMQYLVDDLERLGYTERIPDPADRRAKLVRLTPRGREAVLLGREAIAATERRWAETLGKEKMRLLRELLEELVAVLRAEQAGLRKP